MKNFGFLFLFVILLVSCNSSNHVLPESSVFSNLGNFEISDNEVETYSKELGFKVSRLTEKPNSLNFKNKQDVKLFLKLVKYGDKNNEMNQILERNFKELTKNKDIKNLTRNEIKKSLDQVLSVTSLCQNWNSSHYGSAPLGFATLNFGINLTNGLPSNVSYITKGVYKNVYSVLKIIFLALTFTSIVGVPINLLLHEIIDPNYKERIADYKLERELKELEEYGDSEKISYTFNEEKFRQDVLKNYTRTFFLTNPIRTILINLVFSLIFSAIISKFGTKEDLILAHEPT